MGVPLYAILLWQLPDVAFLHPMAITFMVQVVFMAAVTRARPLSEPVKLPDTGRVDTTPMKGSFVCGSAVIVATVVLYVLFW